MSWRRTNQNPDKSNSQKDSDDPFATEDFYIDLGDIQKNYGKRTGKFFNPLKWKRNSSGFYDYEDSQDDEDDEDLLTSEQKIKALRAKFGLENSSSDESDSFQANHENEQEKKVSRQDLLKPKIEIKGPKQIPQNFDEVKKKSTSRLSQGSSTDWEFSLRPEEIQAFSSESDQSEKKQQQPVESLKPIGNKKPQIEKNLENSAEKSQQISKEKTLLLKSLERKSARRLSEVNYNDDLPKISDFRSKSNKKSSESLKKSSNDKNYEKKYKQKKQLEQIKRKESKKKSENKNKFDEKRKSRSKRKSQQIKQQEQTRRALERKRQLQIKRFLDYRRLEQTRKQEEKRRQQQRRIQQKKSQEKHSKLRQKEKKSQQNPTREDERKKKHTQDLRNFEVDENPKSKKNNLKPQDQKNYQNQFSKKENYAKDQQKIGKNQATIRANQKIDEKETKQKKVPKNRFLPRRQKMQIQEDSNPYLMKEANKRKNQNKNSPELLPIYFEKEYSEIKARKTRLSNYEPDESLQRQIKSFLYEMDRGTEAQSSNQLNKALINTQSENLTNQNTEAAYSFQKKNAFKKKKPQNFQIQEKILKKQHRKTFASINDYKMKGKSDQFLTQSLKKGAVEYHQLQQKNLLQEIIKKQKALKQDALIDKGKRDRKTFQTLQHTHDIVIDENLERKKVAQKNQKATKKILKTNQFKKDIKITKLNKFSQNSEDYQYHYVQDEQQDFNFEEKSKKERTQQQNRRRIKEADKGLKKKDRPKRVSPKKSYKQSSNSLPRPVFPKNDRKKLPRINNNEDLEIDNQNSHQDSESNNSQDSRRYPQRTRVARIDYWNDRVVYNRQRQLLGVATTKVHVLVGWNEYNSKGIVQSAENKKIGDEIYEKFKIKGGSILDFKGFGDQFVSLKISIQKNKSISGQDYGKYIEIYLPDKNQNLRETVTIRPYTGSFTIQNRGNETATIQFLLTINNEPQDYEKQDKQIQFD